MHQDYLWAVAETVEAHFWVSKKEQCHLSVILSYMWYPPQQVFKAAFKALGKVGLLCDFVPSSSNVVMAKYSAGSALSWGKIMLDFGFITSLLLQDQAFWWFYSSLESNQLEDMEFLPFWNLLTLNWGCFVLLSNTALT